jgi:N6-L-threonylcarbamoyladenine synthase
MRLDPSNDVSFSGLKTAVALLVEKEPRPIPPARLADICASFQAAVVDTLVLKTFKAADEEPTSAIVLAGGVSRNEALRGRFRAEAAARGIPLLYPRPDLCTDNAAMIARTAYHHSTKNLVPDLGFPVLASVPL